MSLTICAPAAIAASATGAFIVSIEMSAPRPASPSMTGRTRRISSVGADRRGVAARRFPADVEDGGALRAPASALRDRRLGIEKEPAVGEGIRRDVDDAHHDRRARRPAGAPAAEQLGEAAADVSLLRNGCGRGCGGRHRRTPLNRVITPHENNAGGKLP